MADVKAFILNDETVSNSYGFRILNKGINLKRFKANPVMLDMHYNSTWATIGRWENLRIEGTRLMADPVFDIEDADAKKVAGKVERGFLKGASMGVSFNREFMKQTPDGNWELTKCDLYEASIVAIPSNPDAIRLYASEDGGLMDKDSVKLSLTSIFNSNNLHTNMEKITLSVQTLLLLGLPSAENPVMLQLAVEKLATDHSELQTKHKELETKHATLQKDIEDKAALAATTMVDDHINRKVLDANLRASMIELGKRDMPALELTLKSISPRVDLTTNNSGKNAGEIKTADDFQKLSVEEAKAWREANPEQYNKLFI